MMTNDNTQQTQQAQQPKAAEVFECATLDVVRELDKDIKRGEITSIIEFLTNVGEHLLQKARHGSMTDLELKEYKDYFYDLEIIDYVIGYFKSLNRNCPTKLKPERRCDVWGK